MLRAYSEVGADLAGVPRRGAQLVGCATFQSLNDRIMAAIRGRGVHENLEF